MATAWQRVEAVFNRFEAISNRFYLPFLLLTLPATSQADSHLADAAEKNDTTLVASFLKEKFDPNTAQADGMTALHWAAYHDNFKVAKLLLKNGAHADPKNRYGVTPLYSACQNGNDRFVDLLLQSGVDANSQFADGETALMTAAKVGNPKSVEALLSNGAKVGSKNSRGQTALMWAAAEGNLDVVKVLLQAGADPKAKLNSGFTPMLFAIREGRADVVHALLDAGLDINEPAAPKSGRLPRGSTPLSLAIENGHFELAASLLERGAAPNDIHTGFTPLHILSWVRKPDGGDGPNDLPPPDGTGNLSSLQLAKILVHKGADINARSKSSKTHWTGGTPFYLASWKADVPYMKTLVSLGADPKIPASDGSTAFMAATGIGRTMEALSAGTEPEVLEACKYLLSLEVDINAVNKSGETAMHGAAYKNLPTVVTFLDQSQADPKIWHQRNGRGSTPYLIAAGYRPGNFKPSYETMDAIKAALFRHGIEPTEKPPKGLDPYAKRQNLANQPIKLFNGWDLEGWSIQNHGRFSVQDGILQLDGNTGWLRSEKTYGDFKLTVEFRLLESDAKFGILVRTDKTLSKDKKSPLKNAYLFRSQDTQKIFPPMEWQTYEITAKGEKLSLKLNGQQVAASNIQNPKGHLGLQGEHGRVQFRKIELLR